MQNRTKRIVFKRDGVHALVEHTVRGGRRARAGVTFSRESSPDRGFAPGTLFPPGVKANYQGKGGAKRGFNYRRKKFRPGPGN